MFRRLRKPKATGSKERGSGRRKVEPGRRQRISPDQAAKLRQRQQIKDRLVTNTSRGKFYILNKETKKILSLKLGEQQFIEENIPPPGIGV